MLGGVHVVQEVKLLAKKADREGLDLAISELVHLGLQREVAAESIYRERCIGVTDEPSWAKYMCISGSGSLEDEYDIVTLLYTEEGLPSVDENREGHAATFGDDIAIESLATEFQREAYVVQAHGSDAMVDEDNCVVLLLHRPRSKICGPPFFLFMKRTVFRRLGKGIFRVVGNEARQCLHLSGSSSCFSDAFDDAIQKRRFYSYTRWACWNYAEQMFASLESSSLEHPLSSVIRLAVDFKTMGIGENSNIFQINPMLGNKEVFILEL